MLAPSHIAIGALTAIATARLTSVELTVLGFTLAIVGSLAPDIDGDGSITQPGSLLYRFLPRGLASFLNSLGATLSGIVRFMFGHRGFIHAPLLPAIMILSALQLSWPLLLWFGVGYASHLFADFCTKAGIPLLSPLLEKRYSLFPLRTGSWVESLVFSAALVSAFILGFEFLPESTQQGLRYWYSTIVSPSVSP